MAFVELLLILPVRSLYLSILGRLPRIDEVMNDALIPTENIQGMDGLHGQITPFVCPEVVVREDTPIIRLHSPNPMRELSDDRSEEQDGMSRGLFIVGFKVAPP